MTEIISGYKPRTRFLKQKIAATRFGDRKRREYITTLCRLEDSAYRKQVKHEDPNFYGPYSFLYGEQFGIYRAEYFAMLKELSYFDYVRVLANERSDPHQYGGWRNGRQIPLPIGLSKEDKNAVLELKNNLDKERARTQSIEKAKEKAKAEKYLAGLHRWWIKNGGKA